MGGMCILPRHSMWLVTSWALGYCVNVGLSVGSRVCSHSIVLTIQKGRW